MEGELVADDDFDPLVVSLFEAVEDLDDERVIEDDRLILLDIDDVGDMDNDGPDVNELVGVIDFDFLGVLLTLREREDEEVAVIVVLMDDDFDLDAVRDDVLSSRGCIATCSIAKPVCSLELTAFSPP